jgi:hypothetical protein
MIFYQKQQKSYIVFATIFNFRCLLAKKLKKCVLFRERGSVKAETMPSRKKSIRLDQGFEQDITAHSKFFQITSTSVKPAWRK